MATSSQSSSGTVAFRYWYQSTNTRWTGHPTSADDVLWPPSTLELFEDGQVSYGGGPKHGLWIKTDAELVVEFHWRGWLDRLQPHIFRHIANTNVLILTRVGLQARTDAVLVPMPEAAGDECAKRPRTECEAMLH